jgi:hypothetical protein
LPIIGAGDERVRFQQTASGKFWAVAGNFDEKMGSGNRQFGNIYGMFRLGYEVVSKNDEVEALNYQMLA